MESRVHELLPTVGGVVLAVPVSSVFAQSSPVPWAG